MANINTNHGYYYYTDQLKHNNYHLVKFPANEDHYPFATQNFVGDVLILRLSGYYHIIYTDFYKGSGEFKIYHTTSTGSNKPDDLYT